MCFYRGIVKKLTIGGVVQFREKKRGAGRLRKVRGNSEEVRSEVFGLCRTEWKVPAAFEIFTLLQE
jgi:hypothetical protein